VSRTTLGVAPRWIAWWNAKLSGAGEVIPFDCGCADLPPGVGEDPRSDGPSSARGSTGALPRPPTGRLRRETELPLLLLVHVIEEYARHNGHADLLRERIDGRVGQ
jgi:Protein of unknown function (DUF664).